MTSPRFALGVVVLVLAGSAPVWGQESGSGGPDQSFVRVRLYPSAKCHDSRRARPGGVRDRRAPNGSRRPVGVTLKDDTRVSLGPNSEARIDRFVYAPADGRLGFVFNIVRGVAAYVSGQIAKLAPDSIRLETPAAIVGVRGTSLAVRVEP